MSPTPPDLLARGVPPAFLTAFDTYCATTPDERTTTAFDRLRAPFAQWTGRAADDPPRALNEGLVAMLLHLGGMEHKATDFFRGTNTGAARICADVVGDKGRRDRARRLLAAHLVPNPPPRRQSHPAQQSPPGVQQHQTQQQSPPGSGQHSQKPSPRTRDDDIRHRPRFASLPVIPVKPQHDGGDTDTPLADRHTQLDMDAVEADPWPGLDGKRRLDVGVDAVLEKRRLQLEKRLADVEEREKRVTAREERVAEREGRVAKREERLAQARDRMVDERERRISEG